MVSEVYEALIDAGASEAKAKAAAEAIPVSEQLTTKTDLAGVKAYLPLPDCSLPLSDFSNARSLSRKTPCFPRASAREASIHQGCSNSIAMAVKALTPVLRVGSGSGA